VRRLPAVFGPQFKPGNIVLGIAAVLGSVERPEDSYLACIKVDVRPLQSEQLALPHPGADREHVEHFIFEARGLADEDQIFSVLDAARAAADRRGQCGIGLTLQIQLSTERLEGWASSGVEPPTCPDPLPQGAESIWSKAKTVIRCQIPEIAFLNWFSCTRQIMDCGSRIEVAVPDEPTEAYLSQEYHHLTRAVLSDSESTRFAWSYAIHPESPHCAQRAWVITSKPAMRDCRSRKIVGRWRN
jgi:hypothetical protein